MGARATLIYLLRHGEVVGAQTRRFIGHLDVPLSDRGERQCLAQAARLHGSPLEAVFSSDLQRSRRSGEIIAAFCLTEPASGSDAQAMKATAVPSADGTHYLLNGQKIWISNAGFAGLFTVFAQVPLDEGGKKKQRVTAFIVEE